MEQKPPLNVCDLGADEQRNSDGVATYKLYWTSREHAYIIYSI